MDVRRMSLLALGAGLIILAGCASMQTLTVNTLPEGARVSVVLHGEEEVHARVGDVHGSLKGESLEEEHVDLGLSPVVYEFELDERKGGFDAPEAGAAIIRHFTAGTIRIELEGYRTIERRVRFSGDPISLDIRLEPDEKG